MKKASKIVLIVVVSTLAIVVGGFLIYASDYSHATQSAIDANTSTDSVDVVQTKDYIAYIPTDTIDCGVVFYPGGKVEHSAYAMLCNSLANENIIVVVVKMPLNLAMLNMNAGNDIIEKYSNIDTWYLMGHSLGGVFGTYHLQNNPELYTGMIYLASYPATDISSLSIPTLSIIGTLDTVVDRAGYNDGKKYLSLDSTTYYEIAGGNHGQFGEYGFQDGDTVATISTKEQIAQTQLQISEFIASTIEQLD